MLIIIILAQYLFEEIIIRSMVVERERKKKRERERQIQRERERGREREREYMHYLQN